jgi:RimJ/RimL family protein N-acetyltransferase
VTGRPIGDRPELTVRAISASDADALVRFHEALSHRSQRLRFFNVHPHLSSLEVERFTTVDHHDREALVAVAGSEILGVARYDRLPESTAAEVAFVTRDDHQGSGIATALFHELVARARAEGITRLVAQVLSENRKMLALFARTGLVSERSFEDGIVDITLSLTNAATR